MGGFDMRNKLTCSLQAEKAETGGGALAECSPLPTRLLSEIATYNSKQESSENYYKIKLNILIIIMIMPPLKF